MSTEDAFFETCSFCPDGQLRFCRCQNCDDIVAQCDECDRMWRDVELVASDTNLSSDSMAPCCPACGEPHAEFDVVSSEELEDAGLDEIANQDV